MPEVRFRDAAHFLRPRLGVPGPGNYQVGFGVIHQAVPHRAAAAVLRPVADPGLGRLFLILVLHGLAGRRRNRVELPRERPVLEVVRREEAANEVLAAAHADDHLVARDARRDGERVVLIDVRDLALPQLLAADGVERDQPGVVGSQDELAVVDREPAVVCAAAHMARRDRIDLGVVHPLLFAGARVEGVHDAVVHRLVDRVVPHQRRAFGAAAAAACGGAAPTRPGPACRRSFRRSASTGCSAVPFASGRR